MSCPRCVKGIISIVFALTLGVSAKASLSFTPGEITSFPGYISHTNGSGFASSISSLILTLTFSASDGLNSSAPDHITGYLTLSHGTETLASSALNSIVGTPPSDPEGAGDWSYTVDLSGAFSDSNPNNQWNLGLSFPSGFTNSVNTLDGGTLDITAVPEPVPYALSIFGGLVAGHFVFGHLRRKKTSGPGINS